MTNETAPQANRKRVYVPTDESGRELETIEPESIKHAKELRMQLNHKVDSIDLQLGEMNRVDAAGKRLSDREYHKWRLGAVAVQKRARQRLAWLRNWIADLNADRSDHTQQQRIADALERIANALEGRSGNGKD